MAQKEKEKIGGSLEIFGLVLLIVVLMLPVNDVQANLYVANGTIRTQGWEFLENDTVVCNVTWQVSGGWPAKLTDRTWTAQSKIQVMASITGRDALLATSKEKHHSWKSGRPYSFTQKVSFSARFLGKKAAWVGKYGKYNLYAKIYVTLRPVYNYEKQFEYNLVGKTKSTPVALMDKGAYGKKEVTKKPSSSSVKTHLASKPKYKIIKVEKKIKVPYTVMEEVPVKKQVTERRPVTKYRMEKKTCYKDKKVVKKVPVKKRVQQKKKVRKTRLVNKKVRKKVKVTKYRNVQKRVPETVTVWEKTVTGKKKVTKKLKSTKMVEVRQAYYVNEYVTKYRNVTKTRRVPKTRMVTKKVQEPYECKKNVIVGTKPARKTYTTKKVKKYRTEKKPYKTQEKVYVNKRVKEAYYVTRRVTKYRNVRKPVYKTYYVTRYYWVRKGNRKVRVSKRVPQRKKVYVTNRVPYTATVKEKAYRWVNKRVPETRTVTKYREVRVPYYENVKVQVPSKKTTVLYKTVKKTCYRTVTKRVPEKYYVDEKYMDKEPYRVSKKVKKYRMVKQPKEVVREVYSYEPVKEKVPVKKKVFKTKTVQEPYEAYEYRDVVEKVEEPYFEWVTETVEKEVLEDRVFTQKVEYDCSEKVPYKDYEYVKVTKTVMEKKPVTKHKYKTVYEKKRVPVN